MPEKKSTSKTTTDVADNGPGSGTDLGRASYRAEQARDAVIIFAFGWHPTPGYTDFFEQSPIDIFPPQFIFRSIPPGVIVPQVLTPFAIWVMFGATEPIKTVTVHDADGAHEIPVEQMSKTLAAASQRGTWVAGSVLRGGAGVFNRPTTMAVGEEGGGPTTMATGEEDITAPTTMATGEESGGPTTMATGEEETRMATTMATGEEGGGGPTTMATGEENITAPTTMAVGEEGDGPTTMAVGEEDARASATFGPPITTMAVAEEAVATTLVVGEEGGAATTLAVGEEEARPAVRFGGPPITTLAVAEEAVATTLAVGEEGGGGQTTLAVGEEDARALATTTLELGEESTTQRSPFGTF